MVLALGFDDDARPRLTVAPGADGETGALPTVLAEDGRQAGLSP